MNLFEKVFGTHSDRELKLIYPIVEKIEKLKEDYESKVMQLVQENEGLKRQLDQQLSKGEESAI